MLAYLKLTLSTAIVTTTDSVTSIIVNNKYFPEIQKKMINSKYSSKIFKSSSNGFRSKLSEH